MSERAGELRFVRDPDASRTARQAREYQIVAGKIACRHAVLNRKRAVGLSLHHTAVL